VSLVIIGGADAVGVEEGMRAFLDAGFNPVDHIRALDGTDEVYALTDHAAESLRDADSRGVKYVLLHIGADDHQPGGTFERAHHRVGPSHLADLAIRLRSRERLLVRCIAFGFKNGIPDGAGWVIDVRFLDNPYWDPELRPLNGLSEKVRDHVLQQAPARELLDGVEPVLRSLIPKYRDQGRNELTIAFGCTGGRHRSVVLANEMSRRLGAVEDIDVEFVARDLKE